MPTENLARTTPATLGRVAGIAVPAFIHNGFYFFTELEVFADGLVECWGAVDLDFLARKLNCGWIASSIPNGASISIHDLFQATVVAGEWSHDARSLHNRLLDCLRRLNPSMENLIDFKGEDVEIRNGLRYAKIGLTKSTPCKRDSGLFSPTGRSRFAFVREKGRYYLTAIRIYADGRIDISPRYGDEWLIDFGKLEALAARNDICVKVADGTKIEVDGLGRFEISAAWWHIERQSDLLTEVKETIGQLNGEPDALTKCRAALQRYLSEPTIRNRDLLKTSYEAIPEHHRMYVGDMDTKDIPVRMIIYGVQEIEGWSHRAVARSQGESSLPWIDVPKPEDESES